MVERHAEPAVDPLDFVLAEREELLPEPAVFRVPGVQLGRLGQHGRANLGMSGRKPLDFSAVSRRQFRRLVARRFLGRFLIIHQPADQPVEPGELLHRVPPIRLFVAEVAPAVKDHAELRAPVADVVVADDLMAEEPQHAAQRVADHRRADVAHVHGLGHVRRGVVDDEGPRPGRRRNAEPRIGRGRREPLDEPRLFEAKVDEARAGDFRRLAEIVEGEAADHLGRHFAGRPAEAFAQWHGQVCLVIAELRLLAAADRVQQPGRIVDQPCQRGAEPLFQIGKDTHRGFRGTRLACPHRSSKA